MGVMLRKGVGRKSYPQFVYRFPSNTHVSPEKNEKLENREKQREQTFSPAFWIVLAEFILKVTVHGLTVNGNFLSPFSLR